MQRYEIFLILTNKITKKMKTKIITEQKGVRISLVSDNSGMYYSVSTQGRDKIWYRRERYKTTSVGLQKALLMFYRLILCNIDAEIIIDTDHDFYTNLEF